MTEPTATAVPSSETTTMSISERILGSPETSENSQPAPQTKPSTTVSTIVVQSGETHVVIALLKSGENVEFRILEMNPKLTALGSEVHESEQMLTDHENLIAKLEKKQTPIEDFLRQVNSLVSVEKPDVYVAMGVCLLEAWGDLNSKLGVRTEVLSICHSFHGYRQDCQDSFRKCDSSTRKETLINYSKATETGNQLIEKLRTLEDSWESILRVNYWLDDLRQAMLEWKAELHRQESKEKEEKAFQEYLDEIATIQGKTEEDYSVIRTELLSMFTRIEAEYRLSQPKKRELELKVFEVLKSITDKIEAAENIKLFLDANNELSAPNFTEDYSEKLEQVKELDEDLISKLKIRLEIRKEYDDILETICDNENFDEKAVEEKLSKDETLNITRALENISRKFHRQQLGAYDLFKERVDIIAASIKEGGELQDYILLNDIVKEVDTDIKNAKDFNGKDEIAQKCKNLEAIIQHRISILQDVKNFINENKDLSDDSFRVEHIKSLRRLTDSKDGRILSCILRNRLTVRNVYELVLKSPLDYEEDEIADLISVDQTLETQRALEKIMERRRLLELLKTLDFTLPENLATAKSDLVDFASFENMVANLPEAPEELVLKTNAKKDKILKCIQFYELLEQINDTPEQIELLAALETELFGTTHWRDLIPVKIEEEKVVKTTELLPNRDSISSSSPSAITSIEVLTDGGGMNEIIEDDSRASTATPSLNLSENELFLQAESEGEDRFLTPLSEASHSEIEVILEDELSKTIQEPTENDTKGKKSELILGEVHVKSKTPDIGGDTLGNIEIEVVAPKESTESIHEIPIEVEVVKITKTPVELQNVGKETQIVQEPPELHSVERIIEINVEGRENMKTEITEVSTELKSIGMETQTAEEIFTVSDLIETPESDDEILSDSKTSKKSRQDTIISEEPSEVEATIVEEPVQLRNIAKHDTIVEEGVECLITVTPETPIDTEVNITSAESDGICEPPFTSTSVKPVVMRKRPHEIEREKVEILLAELDELRKSQALEEMEDFKLPAVIVEETPDEIAKEEESKPNSEEISEGQSQPQVEEKIQSKPSVEHIQYANPDSRESSYESVTIPIEVIKTNGSPPELRKPNFNELTEFEIKNIEISPKQERKIQLNPKKEEHDYLDDIITVQTDTVEYETALRFVIENNKSPSKESIHAETQTLQVDERPEQSTVEIQTLSEETKPVTEKSYQDFGTEPSSEVQGVSIETQIGVGHRPVFEYNGFEKVMEKVAGEPELVKFRTIGSTGSITLSEREASNLAKLVEDSQPEKAKEEEKPEDKVDKVEYKNQVEEIPSPSPKPSPREKPAIPPKPNLADKIQKPTQVETEVPSEEVGLLDSPRKSAFVEVQGLSPRNQPSGTQTSPIFPKKSVYTSHESQTSPWENVAEQQTSPQDRPESVADKFAAGMANNLLMEVGFQLGEIHPQKDSEIDHPSGLLQIFKAENELNRESQFEVITSPVQEMETQTPALTEFGLAGIKSPVQERESQTEIDPQAKLEGFKSPVQEMETQTIQPPIVLNFGTQTADTLKRVDSIHTQTVNDDVKMYNIETQTSSTQLAPSPDKKVETEIYYFKPNLFQEVLSNPVEQEPLRLIDEETDKSLVGTSDKIKMFENIGQDKPQQKTTKEIYIPISVPAQHMTVERKFEHEITTPVTRPGVKYQDPVTRVIEIKIPQSETPQSTSPYSPFTDSITSELQSPSLYRTPTPGEIRYVPIKLGDPGSSQMPQEQRKVEIQLQPPTKIPPPPPMPVSRDQGPCMPSFYPWRKASLENVSVPNKPAAASKSETVAYTFGHFEEAKETVPEKQSSVKDRVKYWEPRTSLSEEGGLGPMPEKMPNVQQQQHPTPKPYEKFVSGGDNASYFPESDPRLTPQYEVLYVTPLNMKGITAEMTEESVANAIEERRKELAEYQQRGTVSEFRKMFQSYEQTSSALPGGRETKTTSYKTTETVQNVPTVNRAAETFRRIHDPSASGIFRKDPLGNQTYQQIPVEHHVKEQQSQETFVQRRHSETSSTEVSNVEESPLRGTVARFKKLFQNFEGNTGSVGQPTYSSQPRRTPDQRNRHVHAQSELITSPQEFRTFEPFSSSTYPKQKVVKIEETQTRTTTTHGLSDAEWANKVKYRSSDRDAFPDMTSPLSPTIRPTKFVPGSFHESDYESDFESKIPPVWIPPSQSGSRPTSSIEFHSVTPIVQPTHQASPFIPSGPNTREIPIKTTMAGPAPQYYSAEIIMKPVIGPKPVPPPKPNLSQSRPQSDSSHTIKETSLVSKVTKTEETKYLLRPVRSPQPLDSDDDLNVRKVVLSHPTPNQTVVTSSPWGPLKTTTRSFKKEELVEKTTE